MSRNSRLFGSLSAASEGYSQISVPQQARNGVHNVKFTGLRHDCILDASAQPANLVLQLPHYRARNQPVDEPLKMAVRAIDHDVQLTVTRAAHLLAFQLQVVARSSDVTLWLPSDFVGTVYCTGTVSCSRTFGQTVLPNVRYNEPFEKDFGRDVVSIQTTGNVTLRVWDVRTGKAEMESISGGGSSGCDVVRALRKVGHVLGCVTNKHERYYTEKDWDWLVEN